jgi:hypothetical protein
VALSADGTHAVSGSEEGTVKVWDVGTGALLRSIDAHQDSVRGVAIAPDGMRLASGGEDETAKLWDATSGALLLTLKGHTGDVISVSFSRDGKRLLTGSWDKTAKLWDAGTGALICTFTGHAGQVASAVFSPDGTRVLTSSWDGTAKLWDAGTAALITTFTGHTDRIFSAAISPDGTRVATGSQDTTIRIWSVRTGELLALLLAGPDGGWLTVTRKGFYIASPKGAPKLSIVRGLNVYSLAQLPAALKSTELVKTALADDSQGTYPTTRLSLQQVLDSGPAPRIDVFEQRPAIVGGVARLTVTLTDIGGGIGGRLAWRVKTAAHPDGEMQGRPEPEELKALATPTVGRTAKVTETLQIDPSGSSVVEVFAFNGKEMLATPPLALMLDAAATRTGTLPR